MANARESRNDAVTILLEKVAGEDTCQKDITASSPEALINGLALLIVIGARMLAIPETTLLSILAAQLFGQEGDTA